MAQITGNAGVGDGLAVNGCLARGEAELRE